MTAGNNFRFCDISKEDEEKAASWESRARHLAGQAARAVEAGEMDQATKLIERARLCEHSASRFRQGKTTAGVRKVENKPPPWWQK